MQLTTEMLMTIAISVLGGAAMSWLGNRVVNAELLGHVRRHCGEIAHALSLAERANSGLGDHRERLARIEHQHEIDDRDKGRDCG